jgi:hypothetical protein
MLRPEESRKKQNNSFRLKYRYGVRTRKTRRTRGETFFSVIAYETSEGQRTNYSTECLSMTYDLPQKRSFASLSMLQYSLLVLHISDLWL